MQIFMHIYMAKFYLESWVHVHSNARYHLVSQIYIWSKYVGTCIVALFKLLTSYLLRPKGCCRREIAKNGNLHACSIELASSFLHVHMYVDKNNNILPIELILYSLLCVERHSAFEYTMRQKNLVMIQVQKA